MTQTCQRSPQKFPKELSSVLITELKKERKKTIRRKCTDKAPCASQGRRVMWRGEMGHARDENRGMNLGMEEHFWRGSSWVPEDRQRIGTSKASRRTIGPRQIQGAWREQMGWITQSLEESSFKIHRTVRAGLTHQKEIKLTYKMYNTFLLWVSFQGSMVS